MAERVLRGSRLGALSFERDRDNDLAPRQGIDFDCPRGHSFSVPMATDAEVPATWECTVPGCSAIALRSNSEPPEPKKTKPPRTHWDMLMERRTTEQLEELLQERLNLIRTAPLGRKSA